MPLPQLDTHFFISQLFWFSLSFIVLYLFLKYKIIPNVQNSIFARDETIKNLKQEAEQMRVKSDELNRLYKESLKKALLEAETIKKEALLKQQDNFRSEIEAITQKYNCEYLKLRQTISGLKNEITKDEVSAKYIDLIVGKIICLMKVSG